MWLNGHGKAPPRAFPHAVPILFPCCQNRVGQPHTGLQRRPLSQIRQDGFRLPVFSDNQEPLGLGQIHPGAVGAGPLGDLEYLPSRVGLDLHLPHMQKGHEGQRQIPLEYRIWKPSIGFIIRRESLVSIAPGIRASRREPLEGMVTL